MNTPLAERMRPTGLEGYFGQQHLVAPAKPIYHIIHSGKVHSMIFWGPPGTGKTTLARIISNQTGRRFFQLSAINSGVKEIREVIEKATRLLHEEGRGTILFIDEIHRFNKSQQDSLLGSVESGVLTLIGATTENPSFEVNAALLSRCEVYTLLPLTETELKDMAIYAIEKDEVFKGKKMEVKEWDALLRISGGDGRKLLNALEIIVESEGSKTISIDNIKVSSVLQRKLAIYDKSGEQHYDIVSAFIKSIRGSDPNGAVYWLARMIDAGEDPVFIARRMLILASEDIGNANPTALVLANNCMQAVHQIGYPECRIILSQAATYLASSPKSNASYMAIEEALSEVRKSGDLPVPLHLRNAPTGLMKQLGYGKDYAYAHQFEGNFVLQEFLPQKLSERKFYDPGKNAREDEIRNFLRRCWKGKYGY